ncbi:hypothetical protein MC7420_1999 [Coleofasciculus chthonoplastes PCC 7420]|uniref:Uncharacterized protein n=1 Tax=Coleofasciculus chthonoplastes PCC 7420 TaxID=118168 RepID=B4VMF6_9CYAN|nr:hypothetical protein MC7420_1999 [Coleofasciculus chthonoplastes PCC 7420]
MGSKRRCFFIIGHSLLVIGHSSNNSFIQNLVGAGLVKLVV